MNSFFVSLHLAGTLPPTHELVRLFGTEIIVSRRGEMARNRKLHTHDRVSLRLVQWNAQPHEESQESIKHCEVIAKRLQALTPTLNGFTDASIQKWLRIGTVRRADTGGFSVPPELVRTLAEASLALYISMTVLLDEDEDDADNDVPADDDPVTDPVTTVVMA